MRQTLAIARKELDGYFSSLMALIFVGVFLAVTLFTFFWVADFWARELTDVRPLFRWMPLLMIFLVAALTMRQWSEEQQTGTLEILLTMPVRLVQLVLGKFLAVLGLVMVALALTFFLPITISTLGDLDWGPVVGGYLAAILMAAAYIAIGLFISSRTDNQIVALIVTVLVAGALHLIGTASVTDLFDSDTGELLRNLSTSGRFQSIERGVIDLHDLLYYASLTGSFLGLNVLSLVMRRWGQGASTRGLRLNNGLTTVLGIVNILALNIWLYPVNVGRFDLTEDRLYTLSPATKDILNQLQEPLLVRGYFSEHNHPLLEPLIPQIKDMLEEYDVAANDKLTVEFLDPVDDPDREAEANQTYGISPVPLQVTERSGQSILNIYFHILIRYGDQNEVLTFDDLIAVDRYGNDIEVRLRNLEYDLTSAIKRAVEGFQSVDSVLAALDAPAQLVLYYTPDTLPESLADTPATIEKVASDLQDSANGKLIFDMVNVDASDSGVTRQSLYDQYQIQPIASGFFSSQTYLLHTVLIAGNRLQVIYPSGDLSEANIRANIETALQRAAPGFLKVVGIWTPPANTGQTDMFGQPQSSLQQFQTLQQTLRDSYEVQAVDLSTGQVPANVDVMLVIAPQGMADREQYAIDQYLMRGGSVFMAISPYQLAQNPMDGNLILEPVEGNLLDMLASYGITVEEGLVLDPQNEPFPVPVQRNVGNMVVTEYQALNYPPFVDIRADGMERKNTSLSDLSAITLNWPSPITVDAALNAERDVTYLLKSSPDSWHTTSASIQPQQDLYGEQGFPVVQPQQRYPLAVAVQGSFESYFKDKEIPVATTDPTTAQDPAAAQATDQLLSLGKLERSPEASRLVVVGSAEFLGDIVFQISQSFSGDRYLNNLQLVQNTIDWFGEDTALASIRAKGGGVRLLEPIDESEQTRWEIINYALALVSLSVLGVIWRLGKRAERPMQLVLVAEDLPDPTDSAAAEAA